MNSGPQLTNQDMIPELWSLIFSDLNVKELMNVNSVSKMFFKQANFVWQNVIRKYFPYLEMTRAEDFQTNSYNLFLQEYTEWKNWLIENVLDGKSNLEVNSFMVAALKGDYEKMHKEFMPRADMNLQKIDHLHGMAVSLGHEPYYTCTCFPNTIGFKLAAMKGNLPVVEKLLAFFPSTQDFPLMQEEIKAEAVSIAAEKGYTFIVEAINEQAKMEENNRNKPRV